MKNLPEKLEQWQKDIDQHRFDFWCDYPEACELSDLLKEAARRIRALEHEVKLVG